MDKPPLGIERKLSEYLFRNLSTLEDVLNNFMVESRNRRGGIKKTIDQVIGALGAAYVTVSNYQTQTFNKPYGVSVSLPVGSITILKSGNYTISIAMDVTLTQDNNSSRYFKTIVYNDTDGVILASDLGRTSIGAYADGGSVSINVSIYLPPNLVGKELVLRVGGGSTFAAFTITQCVFTMVSLR